MRTTTITKRYTFEASHNLVKYEGKCAELHGHSYKLEVTFANTSGLIEPSKMVLDFNAVDEVVKPLVNRYDHAYLNNFFEQPTAEVMANSIFTDVTLNLEKWVKLHPKAEGVKLTEVKLWETEKCYVSVKEGCQCS